VDRRHGHALALGESIAARGLLDTRGGEVLARRAQQLLAVLARVGAQRADGNRCQP
jgi:hypothetical protein